MSMRIPNFRGHRALVLHHRDRNRDAVVEQLRRLGVAVVVRWPVEMISADGIDVAFFDSDMGFDGLFAWRPGQASVPLIAMLGSEAPGRIAWTLSQRPCAYLTKPIGSTGVFSALTIAFHTFALQRAEAIDRRAMENRLERRDAVVAAAAALMCRCGVDAEAAIRMLRRESMRRRTPLEAISALVLAGKWLPGAEVEERASGARTRTA